MLGAGLAAQETGEGVGGGRGKDGGLELQNFPFAVVVADGRRVATAEHGEGGDGGERALVKLHSDRRGAIETRGCSAGQGVERDAGDGRSEHHGLELEP